MIKLFLITLLCMAMFADSQEDRMNEMEPGLKKASADMAEHAMTGQGSSLLMQHVAQNGHGGPPAPPGPPEGQDPPEGRGPPGGRGPPKGQGPPEGRGPPQGEESDQES